MVCISLKCSKMIRIKTHVYLKDSKGHVWRCRCTSLELCKMLSTSEIAQCLLFQGHDDGDHRNSQKRALKIHLQNYDKIQ